MKSESFKSVEQSSIRTFKHSIMICHVHCYVIHCLDNRKRWATFSMYMSLTKQFRLIYISCKSSLSLFLFAIVVIKYIWLIIREVRWGWVGFFIFTAAKVYLFNLCSQALESIELLSLLSMMCDPMLLVFCVIDWILSLLQQSIDMADKNDSLYSLSIVWIWWSIQQIFYSIKILSCVHAKSAVFFHIVLDIPCWFYTVWNSVCIWWRFLLKTKKQWKFFTEIGE